MEPPGGHREAAQPGADQHRVACGVGRVGVGEPVSAASGRARDRAGHAGPVRTDAVGRVALLEVGERPPVGHDVLHRLDVGRVDIGLVDVREHAVGDGEPDPRGSVARRADTVLAREVEVGERPRSTGGGGHAGGRGCGDCGGGAGEEHGERAHQRVAGNARQSPTCIRHSVSSTFGLRTYPPDRRRPRQVGRHTDLRYAAAGYRDAGRRVMERPRCAWTSDSEKKSRKCTARPLVRSKTWYWRSSTRTPLAAPRPDLRTVTSTGRRRR